MKNSKIIIALLVIVFLILSLVFLSYQLGLNSTNFGFFNACNTDSDCKGNICEERFRIPGSLFGYNKTCIPSVIVPKPDKTLNLQNTQ